MVVCAYLFYWKVYDYLKAVHFYRSQGVDVINVDENRWPLIGSAYTLLWSKLKSSREGDNYFVAKHALDYMIPDDAKVRNMAAFVINGATIGTGDVKVVEAMYTTKNKYFDKHPIVKDLAHCLTGESILFAETTDDWRKSRKAISPAFYKGKLEMLVDLARFSVAKTLTRFQGIAAKGPKQELDVMEEIGLMTASILLECALGVDCATDLIDFWEGGVVTKKHLAFSLRVTFSNLINRITEPHITFFPMLAKYHITPFERD